MTLLESLITILPALIVILLIAFIKRKLSYFSDRGIPFVQPTLTTTLKSLSMQYFLHNTDKLYNEYKDKGNPCIGFFHSFLTPSILLLDPAIIEKILIKDFSYFHDHGMEMDVSNEPLAKHLFNLRGDKWRTLRHKLLPTFTSGKLKGMLPLIEHCAKLLTSQIKDDVHLRQDVNLKDLYRRYSLSVIACCVFGIDLESIKDENCEFKKILKDFTAPSLLTKIQLLLIIAFPKLAGFLRLKFFNQRTENFFLKLTKDALEMRKSSGIKRNDFVQLLLELKEKGSVQMDVKDLEEDEKDKMKVINDSPANKLEMTDELLSAQAFVFIIGGFDNTSFMIGLTNYMLSKNKDIQQRVRDEIKEAKRKHGGLNYSALKDMKLLEASINEALRMYPPLFILGRECNKPYTLDNGVTIQKGMQLMIPTIQIQNDNQYWPDPEKFYPERFYDQDNKPGTYLPFGDGPRICIAQRMALLMAKIMLAEMLENFELNTCTKTQEPLMMRVDISPNIKGDLWGNFKELKT